MDNTCPEFAKIDETSDYGSNDSSHSSSQEEGFLGSVLFLTAMVRVLFLIASFICPLSFIISRRNEILLQQRKGSLPEEGVFSW